MAHSNDADRRAADGLRKLRSVRRILDIGIVDENWTIDLELEFALLRLVEAAERDLVVALEMAGVTT